MNNDNAVGVLETFEWDQTWIEHTEDLSAPRVLYIGDSISIPTRAKLNGIFGETLRVDGFASSKAADHPHFTESVRLFASQQKSPYRAVLFNNGLHGWHLRDAEEYPLYYARVISQLRALFPGAAFILLLTTPVKDSECDARVRARNRAAAEIAQQSGLRVVDLYHADPALPSYLSADGVHFTDEGYRVLSETIAPVLRETVLADEQ